MIAGKFSSSATARAVSEALPPPATLRRALAQASAEGADLFSQGPRLSCGCLAEWLVQPIAGWAGDVARALAGRCSPAADRPG